MPTYPPFRGVLLHNLSPGVHFMQVSKRLGHSTFTLTLDIYGDYIPEQDGGAANTFLSHPRPYGPPT